jgi:beta-ribofuranosylaminobenzene 5'-phosphate synthase
MKSSTTQVSSSHGQDAREFLRDATAAEQLPQPLSITELESARPHVGLGSLTQLKLSTLRAIRWYKHESLSHNSIPAGLQIATTSGVGLGAFFFGGLVVDGGFRRDPRNPLNGELTGRPAPIIGHYTVPPEWAVVLAIPKHLESLSGAGERDFFESLPRPSRTEAFEIAYKICLELVPAVCERDFCAFLSALKDITALGTKPYELSIHESCRPIIHSLQSHFGFGGLSSLGPTCYGFTTIDPVMREGILEQLSREHPAFSWLSTSVCNDPHHLAADEPSYEPQLTPRDRLL